jgi:hypothetical protein
LLGLNVVFTDFLTINTMPGTIVAMAGKKGGEGGKGKGKEKKGGGRGKRLEEIYIL